MLTAKKGLSVDLAISGPAGRLPPDLELAAYRIVQEALHNTVQHAGASRAWVEARFEADHLVLSVRDDDQGFALPDLPDAGARRGHFGPMGIQERAFLYGSQIGPTSAPGEGTGITVRLRCPNSES